LKNEGNPIQGERLANSAPDSWHLAEEGQNCPGALRKGHRVSVPGSPPKNTSGVDLLVLEIHSLQGGPANHSQVGFLSRFGIWFVEDISIIIIYTYNYIMIYAYII
jgi:hypothetical protein